MVEATHTGPDPIAEQSGMEVEEEWRAGERASVGLGLGWEIEVFGWTHLPESHIILPTLGGVVP